jgi:hypothetical protein
MAEMKISNGPLRLTLTDDKGRVVAALRYPRVGWKKLVIESEDAEFDAMVLSGTRVRLVKRAPASEGDAGSETPEWDPFHEIEWGVRDLLTKLGEALGISDAAPEATPDPGSEAASEAASDEAADAPSDEAQNDA